MNSFKGYLFCFVLLLGLGFALSSCDKDVIVKDEICSCIEQHEKFDIWEVNGVIQSGYILEYETPAEDKSCDLDNGEYVQKSNSTRYRIVCY